MKQANLFFDVRKLRACGRNVIIGRTARIRYPEAVSIGDNCIIDDFTYISTRLELTSFVHISSGCKLIGGRDVLVRFSPFSTLAPNVVVAAGSDDYVAGIATPLVPKKFKGAVEIGDIHIGRHCIVGASSVLLPGVTLHDGAAVGALSLVNGDLAPWKLYAGVPARLLRPRNRARILSLERAFLRESE
jgi:galactoside O-acetyltransferase